jgi:hypothetical protein
LSPYAARGAVWEISGARPFAVSDPARVRVEAASHDLSRRYGAPAAAARFAVGRGEIRYSVAHFAPEPALARPPGEPDRLTDPEALAAALGLAPEEAAGALSEAGLSPAEICPRALSRAVGAVGLVAALALAALRRLSDLNPPQRSVAASPR